MSAISGMFYFDGCFVDLDHIKRMNGRLSHRGPDGSDVWIKREVAFGHQMLYTTNESLNEKLPIYDDIFRSAITADARIDNREELFQRFVSLTL